MCVYSAGGGAHVRYSVGGAGSETGSGTLPLGGNRLMYFTVWGAAQVLYCMGGAGSGTLPFGRSRLLYFTVCEEPALVLYRLGGAGS